MPDMRFAPPKQLRIADRADGLNPERVRSYNERLVLSLLLQNNGISRMEIGERTRLSAQTVSVIVRSLEQEGLVSRGEAMRGRVGPPTIPVLLNPNGAYSVGVDLAPWEREVVLIDFTGGIRFHAKLPAPNTGDLVPAGAIALSVREALDVLPADERKRVTGIGLALPAEGRFEASEAETRLHAELEQSFALPVFVQNEITAAAGAEMMFGVTRANSDHLFCFLGAMLHSRLVLNNHVYTGNSNVSPSSIDVGVMALQRRVGRDVDIQSLDLHRDADWRHLGEALDRWRSECVGALKTSVRSLAQFVDVPKVVISAVVPKAVLSAICTDLQRAVPELQVMSSTVERAPKAVGAGSLALMSRFAIQS